MTTDKQLLEAAAKAAGIELRYDAYDDDVYRLKASGNRYYWNPLQDDGDALRLAVKLGICIEPYPFYNETKHSVITKQRSRSDQLRKSNPTECAEVYGDDPYAAAQIGGYRE